MRSALADSVAMAAAVLLIAVAAALFGSASLQVVAHAAVMLAAVLALQLFSGNTRIVSFGHAAFDGHRRLHGGHSHVECPASAQRAARSCPSFLAGLELSSW